MVVRITMVEVGVIVSVIVSVDDGIRVKVGRGVIETYLVDVRVNVGVFLS